MFSVAARPDNSDRIDLAGTWQIRHDPLSQGLTDRWWHAPPADGWRDIHVPSAWQTVLGMDAVGLAWYRRALPPEAIQWASGGSRVLVRFESVATYARVWVNDDEVGQHLGDYVPFDIDITSALRTARGPTTLVVRVDQIQAPRPPKGVVTENGHVTKGFHDVLSAQHAGLWCGVSLCRAGPATVVPNGLFIDADPAARRVAVSVEVDGPAPADASIELGDPDGRPLASAPLSRSADGRTVGAVIDLRNAPVLWAPAAPRLYTATLNCGPERITQHFGFRTIETGGRANSRILLNGRPIQIRGLLHWGHEPRHIAPAPPPEQARAELAAALDRGFNCICLCMFYPPESYFDLCDELGVLVWQEHPVWKSRMTPDEIPEYKRMYEQFFRRDRRHPSVVIVSGTCEHDSFDPGLGKWWWQASAKALPRTLRQIQTGFLEWTPPEQTHLYDDHVYDNNGRWVRFVQDMDKRISELPPKPFVMGETIISNHWPDIAGLRQAIGNEKPWWLTHGLDECAAYENEITRRLGEPTLARFKRQGGWFAKEHRKFQAEVLRTFDRCAGFVTNTIRDVPICRVGFMDDLDRWRFSPEETRRWLGDRVLLLRTPGHLRGFQSEGMIECELGCSNFGDVDFAGDIRARVGDASAQEIAIQAGQGETGWAALRAPLPTAPGVALVHAQAEHDGLVNDWTLVVVPKADAATLNGCARLDGLPFTDHELAPEFEERSYSSGWGLPCRTWKPARQTPGALMPALPALEPNQAVPKECRVVLAHRLTKQIHGYLLQGGRCVLLAGPHAGGIGSAWINLWGLLPLVVESDRPAWPVARGESDAILALLLHDLNASTTRAIPVDERKLTDHVDPLIRYVYTHDSGIPKLFDAVFTARVGRGMLVATTLDHTGAAGAWLMNRLLQYAAGAELGEPERELDITPMLTE